MLNESLQYFVGEHDFKAYTNRVEHTSKEFVGRKVEYSTIKKIYSIDLINEGSNFYSIVFYLESALYRMVRNIIGTSLLVASNQMSSHELKRLLDVNCIFPIFFLDLKKYIIIILIL